MQIQVLRIINQLRVRPRLLAAFAVMLLVGLLLPTTLMTHTLARWLVAWNTGTILYVILATHMMMRSSMAQMRHRAKRQDEGRLVILLLVILTAAASLSAIAVELTVVKDLHGVAKLTHAALAGITVVSSWAFIQMMFALHYAHDYVSAEARGQDGGLLFPGGETPGYSDFFYFSAVIGTSGQTADVTFTSRAMRMVGTLHCILAYLFNTTVLALLINIGASLF